MAIISADTARYTPGLHVFALSVAILCTAGAALHIIYSLCLSPYCHIPGPWPCKITSLVATYHDVRLQRTRKIHEWHQRYGPVVLVAPGEVSFAGLAATRAIYGATGRHPKSRYFDHFLSFGGERATFNTLDYDQHRERRKVSFAFFQATTIYTPAFVGHVRSRARAFVQTVDRDTRATPTIDFFHRINLYAFDNVTKLLFGAKHSTNTVDTPACPERAMLEGLKDCEVWNTLLFNVPWAHRLARAVLSRLRQDRHFLSAEEDLTAWCTARIAATTRDPPFLLQGEEAEAEAGDDCLLKRLALYRTKKGEPLATSWVYAEVLDNVGAAQATVTVALTYVLWNIARSIGWQDRIRQELAALPCQEDGFPSFADINDAPILEAAIKESYRLNPLSSGRAERVVPVGKEYDTVFVPEGVCLSTHSGTDGKEKPFWKRVHLLQTNLSFSSSRPLYQHPPWPYTIRIWSSLCRRNTTLAGGSKPAPSTCVPCTPTISPLATAHASAWASPLPPSRSSCWWPSCCCGTPSARNRRAGPTWRR